MKIFNYFLGQVAIFSLLVTGCFAAPVIPGETELSSALVKFNAAKEEYSKQNYQVAEKEIDKAIELYDIGYKKLITSPTREYETITFREQYRNFMISSFYIRGLSKMLQQKTAEAILDFKTALQNNEKYKVETCPKDCQDSLSSQILASHCQASSNAGLPDAVEVCTSLIDLNNSSASVETGYYYRGLTYHLQNKYEKAIKDYQWVIQNGNINTTIVGCAYENIGRAFWGIKEYQTALNYFDALIEAYPDYAAGYIYRGLVLLELPGRASDAYKSCVDGKMIDPKNQEISSLAQECISAAEAKGGSSVFGELNTIFDEQLLKSKK